MSPIRLAILALMLVFGIQAARRRGHSWYLVCALSAVLGFGIEVTLFSARIGKLTVDPFDLLGGILVAFLAAEALGLPTPVARRIRIGLYSAEWEYDRRLTALAGQIDRLFQANPGTSSPVDQSA